MLKLGNLDISGAYLGNTEVSAIYLGNELVYGGSTPPTPDPYQTQYLTFRALESGTFKFSGTTPTTANTLQYSVDSGATWNTLAFNTDSPTVQSGGTIMWKASGLATDTNNGTLKFISTGRFEAEGNVMSLISGDTFTSATTIPSNKYFHWLFNGCSGLTSAENMVLPATTLTVGCYSSMFSSCSSLTTAPQLPATTLAGGCYGSMFSSCSSLTTAPILSATTLADYCYSQMFYACTSLTTAPQLPATTLANDCYYSMFQNCTSLTTAPELPATTLADECYVEMFKNCTSLTAITCLATDISAAYCTYDWVNGVASTGTFTSAVGMADWQCGNNGIPTDWTVVGGEPCQEGGYLEIDISGGGIYGADCFTVLPRYIVAITAPSGSRDMLAFSSSPCAHYDYRLNLRNGYILPIDLYQAVGGSEAYIIEEGSTLRGDSYTVILSDEPY